MPEHLFMSKVSKFLLLPLLIVSLVGGYLFYQHTQSITAADVYLETHSVYADSLTPGWVNWSWNGNADFGNNIITFNAEPWGGLYLHRESSFNPDQLSHIEFRVKTSDPETRFRVLISDNSNRLIEHSFEISKYKFELQNDGSKKYIVPLSQLNAGGYAINGIAFQETGGKKGTIQFDDIRLVKIGQRGESITTDNSVIFENSLNPNWSNWSWSGTPQMLEVITFYHTEWAGLYLRSNQKINLQQFSNLTFTAKARDLGMTYKVALYDTQNSKLKEFVDLANYGGPVTTEWKTYTIPVSDLANSGQEAFGVVIHNATGISSTLSVDSLKFTNITNNSAPAPEQKSQVSIVATPTTNGYSVSNNQVFKNGQKITLRGVSWFGAETDTLSPHGLWSRNYKDMIQQIKATGFNAVRMPFCPATLASRPVSGVEYSLNPELRGLNSTQLFDKIITELNNQQLYVLLDHHRPDCQAISQLWTTGNYSESQWITDLVNAASRYKNLEYVMGMDLKNEPHGSATWGTGNESTDWNKAAERAGRAVLSANPNLLMYVQGIQDQSHCTSTIGHWMGGNMEPLDCAPIDQSAIPANKLVLSPHVYGPDVYPQGYFNESNYPSNLPAIWDQHFGRFIEKGYTIVPGEWGGKYGEGDPRDVAWQKEMVNYFKQKKICNSFYWSWNPNSGDTGGILRDDWKSVRQDKLQLLSDYYAQCN